MTQSHERYDEVMAPLSGVIEKANYFLMVLGVCLSRNLFRRGVGRAAGFRG